MCILILTITLLNLFLLYIICARLLILPFYKCIKNILSIFKLSEIIALKIRRKTCCFMFLRYSNTCINNIRPGFLHGICVYNI